MSWAEELQIISHLFSAIWRYPRGGCPWHFMPFARLHPVRHTTVRTASLHSVKHSSIVTEASIMSASN
jgi:hypothetical protein